METFSIHQIVDGIEIDGGDSLVTINATSNVLLAPVTVTASAALAIQFDSDSNESITFDLDATFNDLSALLVSGLSVSGGGEANSDNIVINNDLSTSSGNIELKDVEFVTIDASVDRSLNAKAGSLLLDSVGTIELTGGSQLISMIAEQDVLLTDVSDVGGNAIAASLEIQAGDNVNLRSVSLDGTTTDGSLTVSFDTNVTDANTLLIDGNISNVSTLQFTGGTDANDIVDINADIAAASIAIQDVHNVLIDASVSRNLTAMDGNVSIVSNFGQIQFDNGVSTVAINSMGGSVQLSDVATLDSDLTIDSKSNVTLAEVELNDSGAISVAFDTDDNEAAFLQLNGEIRNATSVTFAAGGTGTDDRINVAGNIDADAGDIDFGNASVVSIDASAARSINAEAGSRLARIQWARLS